MNLAALVGEWIVHGVGTAAIVMVLVFWFAHTKRRYDVIDIMWGPTIFIVTLVVTGLTFGTTTTYTSGQLLVLGAVAVWALRLSLHIGTRFAASDTQDPRYTAMIDKYPKATRMRRILTKIYLVQAVLATVIALTPIAAVWAMAEEATIWLALGVVVWGIGLLIEHIGDQQLARFIRDKSNRGALMQRGLWRYTRHPNYFGEIVLWWGIWLITIGSPYWLVGLIGAVSITVLITLVSGVPQAEKRMSQKKGWAEYKKRTSALVPLPVKQ